MADEYAGWSPYNYCADNPLRFTDPDGRMIGQDPSGYYVTNHWLEQATVTERKWWKTIAEEYLNFTAEESKFLAGLGPFNCQSSCG